MRKLAAITREFQEEHPRNNQARDTKISRNQEDYFTQVSEKIESGVTKKLSQEISRRKSRILGALSNQDESLLMSQARFYSGDVPGISWNSNRENQETSEARSQSDPHPQEGVFLSQSSQEFNPDETCNII